MSFSELSKTVKALPKSFFMVGVFHDKKMIGACICVQVKAAVVYTFYSAHDSAYDKWSPRVFLLAQLYAWCQKHKIELLDLGTSALKGRPNFPLLDFKLRVGATLTPKYKFRKTLI
jgi:Acetyltransferase (GNAT) domain